MDKITLVSKKDLTIQWFNPGSKGGQNSNRHNNCCRIIHKESGAITQSTKHKEAKSNQKDAFITLTKTMAFQSWLHRKLAEIREGLTIEEKIKKAMEPQNILVEGIDENGQWIELEGDKLL